MPVYQLKCSNKSCKHSEIDAYHWNKCPECGSKMIIERKYHSSNIT